MSSLKWNAPTIVLGSLFAGLLAALGMLSQLSPGPHSPLVLAAGLSGLSLALTIHSEFNRSPLWGWVVFSGLGMLAVSCSSPQGLSIGSSLCWTACLLAASLAITPWLLPASAIKDLSQPTAEHDDILDASVTQCRDESVMPAALSLLELELSDDEFEEANDEGCESSSEEVIHSWSRVHTALEDRLEGTLLAEFPAGQSQHYLHVPFLPFFDGTPQAHCECSDARAEAEFDQLYAFGGRLKIRRRGDLGTALRVEINVVLLETRERAARAA